MKCVTVNLEMCAECFHCFSDGGQLTAMTTYVGIVKAKMKLTKPVVSPAALIRLGLVGLGNQMNLNPCGEAD